MGRPKGSKNKPKLTVVRDDTAKDTGETAVTVKKKTGRPKGSKSGYTVSEAALAQRRKNGGLPVAETREEWDYNARLIDHVMKISEIAQNADRNDLLSLQSCFIAYLQLCQQDGFSVSNLSAYAAMGFDNFGFQAFAKREDPEIREFCRNIRRTCAIFRENLVADSKVNPVIGIFWQRNFDGLRNDTEQVQSIQEQEEESSGRGNGSYKEKYRKLIGG